MTEDEVKFRKLQNFKIVFRIGGQLLIASRPAEPLLLGSQFKLRSERMFDELEQKQKTIISQLSVFSLDELTAGFSDLGEPLTEQMRTWARAHRQEIYQKYDRVRPWYLAPFSESGQLADFDYWSRMAFLSLDETLWLSVGLEPLELFQKEVSQYDPKRQTEDQVAVFMKARRELFRRELEPHGVKRTHLPNTILDWINRVDLPIHPGFARMLDLMVMRSTVAAGPGGQSPNPNPTHGGKFDAREKTSLAKLLTAIVITEYGYDPTDRRSPIPKEIQDIAVRLGLEVSQDTIRKFLQLGANHLPEGWKPICN